MPKFRRHRTLILVCDIEDNVVLGKFDSQEGTATEDKDKDGPVIDLELDIPAAAEKLAQEHAEKTGHITLVSITVRAFVRAFQKE